MKIFEGTETLLGFFTIPTLSLSIPILIWLSHLSYRADATQTLPGVVMLKKKALIVQRTSFLRYINVRVRMTRLRNKCRNVLRYLRMSKK